MTVFSCLPTRPSCGYSTPARWFWLIVALATFGLAGCNTNQQANLSSPTRSQIFAGRTVETNPYNPVSYAQNNTGRGGGR